MAQKISMEDMKMEVGNHYKDLQKVGEWMDNRFEKIVKSGR